MTSTVYIAKNVYGGDGLGRLGDGRVIFVPGVWAGEQVKAKIIEEKRGFVRAQLVEVVECSPHRIEGEATSTIPGCVYANLGYDAECETKQAQLSEFFERARIQIPGIRSSERKAAPLAYRNKVVYHFAKSGGRWVLGYRTEPSHEIVDIESDPLAVKPINDKLPEIRRSVFTLLTTGAGAVRRNIESKGNVTIRWTQKTGVKWWIGDAPEDLVLKESTCGLDFEVPAGGFYQVNPQVSDELVKKVVEEYHRGSETAANVLDLYCGVGVFGLCCNPPKLIGIESGRQAVEFAKRNAANQGKEASFFAEQVGKNLRRIPIGARTTIIVDPPRGGLEGGVAEWLAMSKAPWILYVSCDPATLIRDLRVLTRTYRVESVNWFNMFPRTARFETLVTLTNG